MQYDIRLSLTSNPLICLPPVTGVYYSYAMKLYTVKSPSGQILRIWADSIEHAIQLATMQENWQYSPLMYYSFNNIRPSR